MHTHQSSPILTRRIAALVLSTAVLVLIALMCVASARAAEGSQYSLGKYGEVSTARFGEFDSTWYDGGAFDGGGSEEAPTPGKFLYPTGFAVDTNDLTAPDGTAIYVLDRVSAPSQAAPVAGTRWRLQKLSDSGAPLALTEFLLPKAGTQPGGPQESTVEPIGLTVSDGAVYTVLAGTLGTSPNVERYAEEVVGWSTTASGGKLVAATASADTLSQPLTVGSTTYSVPSVVSTFPTTQIYSPRGLTADGTGSLVVLGDATNRVATDPPAASAAPALAVQVAISGGAESATWSSAATAGLQNDAADSISTDVNTGDIDVLLYPTSGARENKIDLVDLHPDLTTPTLLEGSGLEPADFWASPFSTTRNVRSGAAHGVWLSNGLYASSDNAGDTYPATYWGQQNQQSIRLTSPLDDGTLSDAADTDTTYDTLGQSALGACDINAGTLAGLPADVVLAPGKSGSLWMLNIGNDVGSTYTGRVVTEFAPNAAGPCVSPPSNTTFTLTDENAASPSQHPANDGPLTIPVGHTVKFDTESLEYPIYSLEEEAAAVYAVEWDPIGGAVDDSGYSLVAKASGTEELWPIGTNDFGNEEYWTTEEYQYLVPGVYQVKMKVLGELGEYDAAGTVVVQTSSPPTAAFTLPGTATAGQAVSVNASTSQPATGATITNYHWNFGDGKEDDTTSATDSHEFAAAGTYTVKLTVRDNDNQQSTTVSHQITVSAPTDTTPPPSGNTTTPTPTPVPTPTPIVGTPKPQPKGSGTAANKKKLAAALKVCKKKKAGKPRKACEKTARAKYSGKSKK